MGRATWRACPTLRCLGLSKRACGNIGLAARQEPGFPRPFAVNPEASRPIRRLPCSPRGAVAGRRVGGAGLADPRSLGRCPRRDWAVVVLQPARSPQAVELTLSIERPGRRHEWGLQRRRAGRPGRPHAHGPDLASAVDVMFRLHARCGRVGDERHDRERRRGKGTFDLFLSAAFADELQHRGVGRPSSDQQVQLWRWRTAGSSCWTSCRASATRKPNVDQFVRCAQHGVTRDFVHDMVGLGYKLASIDESG